MARYGTFSALSASFVLVASVAIGFLLVRAMAATTFIFRDCNCFTQSIKEPPEVVTSSNTQILPVGAPTNKVSVGSP